MPVDWSAAPSTRGLKLKWGDGWIEDFPEDEFAEECVDRPRKIWMYRGKARCAAEYSLTIRGRVAELDYGGRFEEPNSAPDRELYIGVTRITFTDELRVAVRSVQWKDEGKRRFESYDTYASWTPEAAASRTAWKLPRGDRRERGTLEAVLRPGQLRFRRQLLKAYPAGCCITNTSIPYALEAAHIVPHRGAAYDHVQNGLLVRADIHRLLDQLLLSINPKTRSVRIAADIEHLPEYAALNGKPLREPATKADAPAQAALEDHWRRFIRHTRLPPNER